MNRAKNIVTSVFVAVAIMSCVWVAVGYLSNPFKPIAGGSLYLITKSPNDEYYGNFTVRAYYSNDGSGSEASRTLWCEFAPRLGLPKVFYIERNAKENAIIEWAESDKIVINGIVMRLPISYLLWERQE